MTQEEKAKAYDKALKWMRDLYPNLGIAAKEKAESIFPELCVSEDEKVKKEITELVMQPTWKTEKEFYRRKEFVDWVEKQGKQKLALSEEDEEIRKWIINEIKIKHHNLDEDNVDFVDKPIAWLEKQGESDEIKIKKFLINKGYPIDTNGIFPTYEEMYNIIREGLEEQGEQKPVDNVSANFKVKGGKWYVCTQTFVLRGKVVIIKGQTYQAEKDNVIKGENGCRFIDRHDGKASDYFRPWTIQDAKDGNVLAEEKIDGYLSPFVALYKKIDEECDFESYCFIGFDGKFYKGENGHSTEEIHPATKEQRDLLFQKMKEEGYEWDDDKKVLIKKIEEKNLTDFENAMMHIGESFFGKNAGLEPNDTNTIKEQAKLLLELTNTHKWSEDDEKLTNRIEGWLDTLCDYLKDNSPEYIEDVKNTIEQLNSLKEKIHLEAKGMGNTNS